MIAVTFALPAESSELIRRLQNRSQKNGLTKVVSGSLRGKNVVVLHTGVGAKISRQRIADFLKEHSPDLLISAGFAGALTNELNVADLLLAKNFSTPASFAKAEAALSGSPVHTGKLTTTATMIDSFAERDALARNTGAIAVDMETEIIAAACAGGVIPMLSLRAVTDTVRHPFPAPAHILFDLEKQETNLAQLWFYLLKHPAALGRLAAFARRVTRVRRSLTEALEVLIQNDPP